MSCFLADCLTHSYVSGTCECTQCNTGFFLDILGNCIACSVPMPSCTACSNDFTCLNCNPGHVSAGSSCVSCSLAATTDCQTLGYDGTNCVCTQCNIGFTSDGLGGCVSCAIMPNCL